MSEYTIAKVSSQPPREWSFADKKTGSAVAMETYKVMLKGEDEPVEINRKPGNQPAVGELLSGTIESNEYGRKFKAERKPFTPSPSYKDTGEIKAEWSIGQAVNWLGSHTSEASDLTDVEPLARDFFHMVERIKTSTANLQEGAGFLKARAAVEAMKARQPSTSQKVEEVTDLLDVVYDVSEDPINLDDIPF